MAKDANSLARPLLRQREKEIQTGQQIPSYGTVPLIAEDTCSDSTQGSIFASEVEKGLGSSCYVQQSTHECKAPEYSQLPAPDDSLTIAGHKGSEARFYKGNRLQQFLGVRSWELVEFDALPEWMKDNEAIHSHYRPELNSLKACAKSLLYLHNETVNIYSHLLGLICAVVYSFFVMACLMQRDTWAEVLAFESFFLGTATMLLMSSTFHTLYAHSRPVAIAAGRCDYVGIAAMIAGSYSATIYFGFMCDPWTLFIYETSLLALTVACALVTFRHEFDRPHWRKYRALLFVLMGFSGAIPVLHAVIRHGLAHADNTMQFSIAIWEGPVYLSGALLYATRIPERFFPGRLDLFGNSHQIHHVCVLISACIHLYELAVLK